MEVEAPQLRHVLDLLTLQRATNNSFAGVFGDYQELHRQCRELQVGHCGGHVAALVCDECVKLRERTLTLEGTLPEHIP